MDTLPIVFWGVDYLIVTSVSTSQPKTSGANPWILLNCLKQVTNDDLPSRAVCGRTRLEGAETGYKTFSEQGMNIEEILSMTEARSDAWLALALIPFLMWLAETVCLTLLNMSVMQMTLGQIGPDALHLAYISGVFLGVMGLLTNSPFMRRALCLGLIAAYAWFAVAA